MPVSATTSDPFKLDPTRLKRAFEWVSKRKGSDPQIELAIDSTIWLAQVDSLRDVEEQLLESGADPASPEYGHRATLSQLIAQGEKIVFAAKINDISRLKSGVTVKDLEAAVESLRISFRCQYGPKNSQNVNQSVQRLFDVSQSKD